jgi:transcriptional regulator with GAF, ATPase, and Fis domain
MDGREDMNILEKLSGLNRQLLQTDDMNAVLKNLLDAALEISGARNGLLLLKDESDGGPLPGFGVVTAKNLSQSDLGKDDFVVSLSAVKEAAETGEPVVTDNALQDPRFRKSKSVELHSLKSILALPLKDAGGVMGVFYLDNPLDAGIFSDETVSALKAFGDLAALALQKARMIGELKKANSDLTVEVEEEMGRRQELEREMEANRLKLRHQYGDIVGRSPKMIAVLQLVDKITDSKVPVWIYGESGTGKEAIARALHFNSARAKHPFVSENCSALPETLLESELFGHKKGAFTHADRDKKGRFEYANKGTVFLDEIADMSANLQAKLLRFLQEGEVRPVGSNDVVKVDVRVVSASNKDLARLVEEGKFREDLFYRLNGITITLPPLRERMEDLPLLIDHFLKGAAQENMKIHPDALRFLMNYPWPGNIRELQNTIETAMLFAENGAITPKSFEFKPAVLSKRRAGSSAGALKAHPKAPMEPELEKVLLALRDQGYHKGNAAKVLGISRRNLYTKLEKYGVPFELKDLKSYIDERFI